MAEVAGYREFVAKRSTHLLRVAYLLVGDVVAAQDLVQEALVKSWFAWRRIAGADPEAYVRKVMVNTYVSGLRRKRSREFPTARLPERGVEDGTQLVERQVMLVNALRKLPRRQRALIVLRYFEDMTEAQTADALGCSVGTVKSQTSRALARLRADPGLTEMGPGRADGVGFPVAEGA